MVSSPKIGRHDLLPLTPVELATLRLWLDGSFNFAQWRDDPPQHIIFLRERYLAAGAEGIPPTDPPAVATAAADDSMPGRWDELLKFEVSYAAILIGLVLGILASVAVAIVP